jgi:hypothetical protein
MNPLRSLVGCVVALFVLMGAAPLHARQLNEERALSGIRAVYILVEDLHPDAEACGIRMADLQLSVARPLVDAGIRIDGVLSPVIYLRVNAMLTSGGLCVASIGVEARATALAKLSHQTANPFPETSVFAALWDEGELLTGAPNNFGQRVNDKVRRFVDHFATKVKIANQR